jgi:DNA-binding CsgD family transcriptional regulator
LLLQNKTNKEIAKDLGIRNSYVYYYVSSVAKHLGVTRRDLFTKLYDVDRICEKLENFNLTHKEKEVMRLAISGLRITDICKVLKKTEHSVVKLLYLARRKIGAKRIVDVYHKIDPDAIRQDFVEKALSLYPVNLEDAVPPAKEEKKYDDLVLPIGINKGVTYG